ncbi:MAG: glycosyltransferase family 4 protein [Deltaproteobacteria bacterium]|nr:MAG: glycosyltransferase family 4 protein [Deltaproteobacteria bacterium]
MRIAMLCHRYLPHIGGVEIVVKHLASELARQHEVSVIAGALPREQRVSHEDSVKVHRLAALDLSDRFGIPYPLPLGPGMKGALDAVRNADVIHVHGSLYLTSAVAAAIARRREIPLIVTEHVGLVPYRRSALNALQRFAWRSVGDFVAGAASALVACGDRVARWMRDRYPRTPVHLVPNGVDCKRFCPLDDTRRLRARDTFGLPRNRTLALFVGRQSEKKNAKAVLEIPRDHFDLVVCGSERRVQADGVLDVGTLPYERMADLLGCVDFLVHAGVGEGFPLVVQESLACGVPVVLLWDPGYAPVIDRDAIRACDTLEQFRAEVLSLAVDHGAREKLRRMSRDYAERRWSWTATAAEYLRVYQSAVVQPDGAIA